MAFPDGLCNLGPAACRELLHVPTLPDHVRGDLIGQFHRAGKHGLVEPLIQLEEKEWGRQDAIEELQTIP